MADRKGGRPSDRRRWLTSAIAVGWLAGASLIGWLEEVARAQAIEHHFGLPLSMSADPRAAVAFAGVRVAAAIAANLMLVLAVAVAYGRRIVLAAVVATVGICLVLAPQHPWWRLIVVLLAVLMFILAVAAHDEACLESADAWLRRAAARAVQALTDVPDVDQKRLIELRRRYRRVGAAAATAAAAAAAVVAALAIGDRVGREESSSSTVFFVVADRACAPDEIVVDFVEHDNQRIVRIAQHDASSDSWVLLPGIFTVSVTEPVVQAEVGRLKASRPSRLPLSAVPRLPPVCR